MLFARETLEEYVPKDLKKLELDSLKSPASQLTRVFQIQCGDIIFPVHK